MQTTTNCHYCDSDTARFERSILVAGEWVRIDFCLDCGGRAKADAKTPRRPRQPRRRPALYGDFAAIAAINGIATDGSGRSVR